LTLAIVPALITWCGTDRYTIPQVDVEEILHLDAAEAEAVHRIEGVGLHRLRGRLLPLVDLSEQLGRPAGAPRAVLTIVVVTSAGRRFGLVVDSVGDMTEAVMKPLPRGVRGIAAFVGVTILGDGRPSLILDVAGIATLAGIASGVTSADDRTGASRETDVDGAKEHSVLVAVDADGGRVAVDLESVRRLEQFDGSSVERSGNTDVVQYGDVILPLIRVGLLSDGAGSGSGDHLAGGSGRVQTVVCHSSVGLVGLVVHRIEDIFTEPARAREWPSRRGMAASLVVDDRVTDLVDVESLITEAGLRYE